MIKRPTPPPIDTGIVIIGAGVAGLTLAEKLLETDIDFWVLGSPYESQLAKAGELDASTPLPENTVGLKFIEEWVKRLEEKQIQLRTSLCTGIEKQEGTFLVKTKYQDFSCKQVVIATGCKQKQLGFDGELEFLKKGISDCSVCDFPLFRNKPLAVIGNHEYTRRAAVFLRSHSEEVSLLWYHKGGAPEISGVDVYDEVDNVVVSGTDSVERIDFTSKGDNYELSIMGIFVEGEPVPNADFTGQMIAKTPQGHVVVDDQFKTNIDNIWAIGDVTGRSDDYQSAQAHVGTVFKQIMN